MGSFGSEVEVEEEKLLLVKVNSTDPLEYYVLLDNLPGIIFDWSFSLIS